MKTIKTFFLLFLFSLGITAHAQISSQDSVLYRTAILNAMYPEKSKVYNELTVIDCGNKELQCRTVNEVEYILVVAWMKKEYVEYYKPFDNQWGFYNTGQYPMWVTVAPELVKRMKKEQAEDKEIRLKQLLGLNPDEKQVYSSFIEIWVQPSDLIRPCPDQETSDTQCDVCFPSNVNPAHKEWINNNRIQSYYGCGLKNQFPWTALGYTYDWNPDNKTHVGLSEFIVPVNTNVVIEKIYSNIDYFKKM